jgi:hypothetical protein
MQHTISFSLVAFSDCHVEVDSPVEQLDEKTMQVARRDALKDPNFDPILKFNEVRNLCYQGNKDVIDIFKEGLYSINTVRTVELMDQRTFKPIKSYQGQTTFLYECNQHPDLLIQLLQRFTIEPAVLNATITAQFNLLGYEPLDSHKPTNLIQLTFDKKNLFLLQALLKQPHIDLDRAMINAVTRTAANLRRDKDQKKVVNESVAFLASGISLIQDEITKREKKLSETQTALVNILKENFTNKAEYICNPKFLEQDLAYLTEMERKPHQEPTMLRVQLNKVVEDGHVCSLDYLLRQLETFKNIAPFADILDTALSNPHVGINMTQKLFQHPSLDAETFAQVGHNGNTLEVLVRHYAKANEQNSKNILVSMISLLLSQGVPPEDRNGICITTLMGKLRWSDTHDESEKQQFKAMLKPFTRKYDCGPRTCALLKQTASNVKTYALGLFGKSKAIAQKKPVEEMKRSSPSLSHHDKKE